METERSARRRELVRETPGGVENDEEEGKDTDSFKMQQKEAKK